MTRVLASIRTNSTPFLAVLGFLVVWELATILFKVPKWLLPPPTTIWVSFLEHTRLIQKHIVVTATEAVGGLTVGALVGIVIASLMVHSKLLERILMPLLVIDQSVPKLALAPLFVIWFGVGMNSKIFIAMVISFFPLIVNTARGLTAIDPRLGALMHTLSANKWQTFTKVRAPNALPYIFTGLKVAVPLSIVGAVVGEFVQADAGLGFMVLIAVTEIDTALVFVSILSMAVLSLALFGFLSILEALVLRGRFGYMAQQHTGQ